MMKKSYVLWAAIFILWGCDDGAGASGPVAPDVGLAIDKDGDEIPDSQDVCPDVYDPDQKDLDGDGQGDICDDDDDGDGVLDGADGCPQIPDPRRIDTDGDGQGDACDLDDDGDGIADVEDACPLDSTFAFGDLDGDGRGDACDRDRDGDGVDNDDDNCPDAGNASQEDVDGDGAGNECDVDADGDGIANRDDNCRLVDNADQADADEDGVGDACDFDRDGDSVDNIMDNCPDIREPGQADRDEDGVGDVCDPCPLDPNDDIDEDGHCASEDNCPVTANPAQGDSDEDGIGDACDGCPEDALNDRDQDGWCRTNDNCPLVENPDQSNVDGDDLGDACDTCPLDGANDVDGDGICGEVDLCPLEADPEQSDLDSDGLGDFCDACPLDATNDPDQDGVCNDVDLCPEVPDPPPPGSNVQADRDGDGLGDACDRCLRSGASDQDNDGVCAEDDNCPWNTNPNQADRDGDGLGDVCDRCRDDANNDIDEDGLCGDVDVCPDLPDPAQDDIDGDRIGDRCDPDVDGDGVANEDDNCPYLANEDQANTFGGPQGDVCELLFFYEDFEDGLAGWEQSGSWITDESAAFRGEAGMVEGDNRHTRIVAVNSPPIDLTRSERPRLSFWVRRQAGQAFFVDVYFDRDLNSSFRVSGLAADIRDDRDGFEFHTFDLRGFEGRDGVRVRFRMEGDGGWGRLTFDEVTVDENPRPPSLGIPFRDNFDTLENWRPSEDSWSLAGPAWSPEFAATVPAKDATPRISTLTMRYGLDLRASRNPRLVVWARSGGGFSGEQRVEMLIEPANGIGRNINLFGNRGNTLYTRTEISLVDQIGDPDVRITFRYHHSNRASPAIFIDDFAVEETPRPPVPRITPADVEFPNDQTTYLTEGWDVVRDQNGVGRLVTTVNRLPAASKAKARVGPYDLTFVNNPLLRIWARYSLRPGSQSFKVNLEPQERRPRFVTLVSTREGGSSGLTERFDVPLSQVAGDRALNLDFIVQTDTANREPGVEIERIAIVEDPALRPVDEEVEITFEEGGGWSPVSGEWLNVDGLGTDGSRALLGVSSDGPEGWDERASVQLGPRVNIEGFAKPRVAFDLEYLDVEPNHTLQLIVEGEDRAKTFRLARFQNVAFPTEGVIPVSLPLSSLASDGAVSFRLEVVAPDDALYAFVIDNFRVYDAVSDPRSVVYSDGNRPYSTYLNGVLVTEGELFGVSERAWVQPRIGRNVLAIASDGATTNDLVVAGVDLGDRVIRTGGTDWRVSERAPPGWNTVDFMADEVRIGNFEDQEPFGLLADFDPAENRWWTDGGAFGPGPALRSAGNNGRDFPGYEGRFVVHSGIPNDNATGSLYSPVFTLERAFLHFMLAGGNFPDGSNGGCACVRLWGVDENGERTEVLQTWTGPRSGDMSWRSWAIPEEHLLAPVQLQIADERTGSWGAIVADDFYLSDDPEPHGAWMKAVQAQYVGVHNRYEEWSLFDLSLGARFTKAPFNGPRFYRLEFEVFDRDGDGVSDGHDLCPDDPELELRDSNHNGVGDRCDPCPECGNVALRKPTAASNRYNNDFHERQIVDGLMEEFRHGDTYGYWLLGNNRTGWSEVDLRGHTRICVVRWMNTMSRGRWDRSTGDWRITVFSQGVEEEIASGSEPVWVDRRWNTTILDDCIEGDRVRFYADSFNGSGAGLSEIEVYGQPVIGPRD